MQYQFPYIENLDQFRALLKNPLSYREVQKDGYVVFNYNGLNPDNFPEVEDAGDAAIRECRGIAFDLETGKIISRPFHKFFNYGERPETSNPDTFSQKYARKYFFKLDGSMIHPLKLKTGVRLATKAGITDTSFMAEIFTCDKPNYLEFLDKITGLYMATPIFEFTSRQNKIVVDYKEDRLTLLDIRQMNTGDYFNPRLLKDIAASWNIPLVEEFADENTTLGMIHINVKEAVHDHEGVVARFENGHRVKIKSDWYVKLHRYVDITRSFRHLIEAYSSEEWDDIYSNMDSALKDRIDDAIWRFEDKVDNRMTWMMHDLQRDAPFFKEKVKTREMRKAFAEHVKEKYPFYSQIAFRLFVDYEDIKEVVELARLEFRKHFFSKAKKDEYWKSTPFYEWEV